VRPVLLVVAATEPELRGAEAAGAEELVCGVGPVDAAAATGRRLRERRPAALLHVGLAGCRRGCGLEPPRLVIGSESVYCDAAGPLVASLVVPAPELLEAACGALPQAAVLPIGTSARVGGTDVCEVEAMEGFAVLRAASVAGVPALEVRAVANEIEEEDRARWRFDDALAALGDALPALIATLERCAA
jgi:futalosine hydrolase